MIEDFLRGWTDEGGLCDSMNGNWGLLIGIGGAFEVFLR